MPRVLMERSGEMEVFVRVVHDGSFSAAARALDLTPSAVSKLVARLESRLGTRLFSRTTRAVLLTEEGRAYFGASLRTLQELNAADEAVTSNVFRGRLAINASLPFGTKFVAPAIPGFLAKFPDLRIDLSFTDALVDLLSQKADLAFRTGALQDSSLRARKIGESPRVVCAAPSYLSNKGTPKTPNELHRHNCLTFNFRRSPASWPFREKGRSIEVPISGSLQLNNGETMRQLVLAGAGIARLGYWHVAEQVAAGELVLLLEKFNPRDHELISAVYTGGAHVPRRIRAFIDHMVAAVSSAPGFA
jgi:DNA-binding transcriptional LysR family regulator